MKLRRVEVFVAVAGAGGFSAAASRLHIAQSAVSAAIRDLEQELETRLFVRSARAVALTESGRLLLARAEPALRQLHGVAAEIRDLERLAVGHVRLAAPAIVTQHVLARPLVSFAAAHPGVRLRVVQGGARQIEEQVLARDVEMGIVAEREFPPELESCRLTELDNMAFVPSASPLAADGRLAWRDLLRQPLAVFPPGYHQRALLEQHAERLRMRPQIVVEAEHPAVLLEAVRTGLAVTTLPGPAAEGLAGVRGAALPQQDGDRLRMHACWRRDMPLGQAAQALLDHLRSGLAPRAGRRRRDG